MFDFSGDINGDNVGGVQRKAAGVPFVNQTIPHFTAGYPHRLAQRDTATYPEANPQTHQNADPQTLTHTNPGPRG